MKDNVEVFKSKKERKTDLRVNEKAHILSFSLSKTKDAYIWEINSYFAASYRNLEKQ